jgi:hypothetical protein
MFVPQAARSTGPRSLAAGWSPGHRGARLRLVRRIVAAFACGDLLLMAVVLAYYFGVAHVRATSSKALWTGTTGIRCSLTTYQGACGSKPCVTSGRGTSIKRGSWLERDRERGCHPAAVRLGPPGRCA